MKLKKLKFTTIVVFVINIQRIFPSQELAPTHSTIVIQVLSIHLFSFIHKSAFLFSKGLLCLYYKQNNRRLLVDMEFSSRVQLDISLVRCAHSLAIELNTRREIPYLRAPMYCSLFQDLHF